MGYKIEEIEGIGPAYGKKLAAADITNTDHFLKLCCDKKGRAAVAEKTGIGEKVLLGWANMADLMRIKGVARQYSELLEAAGVDTVKELRTRNAENLAAKMGEVNDAKNLANSSPSAKTVAGWVEQAKTMEPAISH
jgi:predicted flap endonuclease-1-like 5' DNA nuclease